MRKRLLACLLMLSLVWTPCILPAAAAQPEQTDKAVRLLTYLGIADGEALEGGITKAAFTDIVLKMIGYDMLVVDAGDVNWPAGAVAYRYGILDEYRPTEGPAESMLTYPQAVKMLVCALGYKQRALTMGGYPGGYLLQAQRLAITDGVPAVAEVLTKGQALTLAYNALHAPYLYETTVGVDGSYQLPQLERTLLEDQFGLYQMEGVLNETEWTALTRVGDLPRGSVKIGDVVYDAGETDAASYLGYHVEGYYRDADGTLVIALLYPDKNNVLDLDADDVLSLSEGRLAYDNGEEEERAPLSPLVDCIVNGIADTSFQFVDDSIPQEGQFRLVDNDNDGAYDVILLTDYRIAVVSTASAAWAVVTDKLGGPDIVLSDDRVETVIFKNGRQVEAASLSEWNVLNIARSRNQEGMGLQTIYVTDERVSGTVTELDDRQVTIDGRKYAYTEQVRPQLVIGHSAQFYLDMRGKIAAVDLTASNAGVLYGFLRAVDASGLDGMQLRMFRANGTWETFEAAQKCYLNGVPVTREEAVTALSVPQLVVYVLNGAGQIREVYTVGNVLKNGMLFDRKEVAGQLYKTSDYSFGEQVYLNMRTKVFLIPSQANIADESRYAIADRSYFANDTTYTVEAYRLSEMFVPDVVVCQTDGPASVMAKDETVVVSSVVQAVDETGTSCEKLTGYVNGTQVSYLTEDGFSFGGAVGPGDAVRLVLRGSRVTGYSPDFRAQAPKQGKQSNHTAEYSSSCGTVLAWDGEFIKVDVSTDLVPDSAAVVPVNTWTYCYAYYRRKNTLEPAALADIGEGMTVYVRSKWGMGNVVVMIVE